jgi:SAM-dependent methyltransferase
MNLSRLLNPILYYAPGRPTPILKARMQIAKYASTRGWVIPFLTVRSGIAEKWRAARRDDGIGYKYYLELDDLSRTLLKEIAARTKPADHILDLGCNVGRELNHLWSIGYRHLTGVEIGVEPVRAMGEVFPEMALGSRIFNKSMTEAVREFEAGEFELVYAHGSLVSLSAREQFVFDEMARISRRYIVTMENEWSLLLFPRDFGRVFGERGFRQIYHAVCRQGASEKQAALRIFEKVDSCN